MHVSKPVRAPALVESITAMLGDSTDKIVRVLLADDDPMVAAYVSKVLPAAQFHLEVVNNGEECLHLLRTQPQGFDLLLLDLMMPDTSGFDVLREMALRGTAASMPVIVLTAHPEVSNPEERRLLDHGLVLEVLPKTAIHERPRRLTDAIETQLASIPRRGREAAQRVAVERADDGSARTEVAERRAA